MRSFTPITLAGLGGGLAEGSLVKWRFCNSWESGQPSLTCPKPNRTHFARLSKKGIGSWVISALLVVISQVTSSRTRIVLPVVFQLQPSFKGYGDSPRPNITSLLHMTEAPSAKFLLKKVKPEYPNEAKVAGVEGDVVFRIIIAADGRVKEIHLRRGKPLLIKAAVKAVSKWRYKAFMLNGNDVEVETSATVQFRLPRKHQ